MICNLIIFCYLLYKIILEAYSFLKEKILTYNLTSEDDN